MFEFSFGITKEEILNKISEEAIFCYYLHLSQITKKLFCSPLRNDKHPTCSFFRGTNQTLYYHDFATGEVLNCFSLVMRLYNCQYYEALRIIAGDFGIKGKVQTSIDISNIKTFKKSKDTIIQIEDKPFTKYELDYWLQYGITKKTLQKFKVHSCRSVFLNNRLFTIVKEPNLVFGYYGNKLQGKELWRIYYPLNKENNQLRFLSNWPGKKIQGFEYLPDNGNILCITKSMKDVMLLYEFGIPAIAPTSENLFIPENILTQLKTRFKYIVVLYDTDIPGIHNMRKFKKLYPDLIYTFIPRKYKAKDLSDFFKVHGKQKCEKLIIKFLKWLKNKN